MDSGEIAVNELGEQPTRPLETSAEMEKDRAQRVAGVHGGVKNAGRGPALRARSVVGGEQAPDRLLRGLSQRRSAGRAADGADQTGEGFLVPQRLPPGRIEAAAQAVLGTHALRVLARRDRRQRRSCHAQHVAYAQHQNAVDQRSVQVELAVEASVIGKTPDVRSRIGSNEIDQAGDAQRSGHRRLTCPRGSTRCGYWQGAVAAAARAARAPYAGCCPAPMRSRRAYKSAA